MNYDIHYLTEYHYGGMVADNLNALRVRPATTTTQRCDEFHVRLDPEARITRHVDYFGTEVLEFGVARPHDHLLIDVRARVVTSQPDEVPATPWDELYSDDYLAVAGEFLLPTGDEPRTSLDYLIDAVRDLSPIDTLRKLCTVIPDRFAYQPGISYVGSTIDDLLANGAGVCQDFVHLSLVLLRQQGIAARYVSGYFFSTSEAGGSDSAEVQTHAWVEALMPAAGEHGEPVWVGGDPTNRQLAGEAHVKIGHGRNYADVPPTKGVYFGSSTATLTASVRMTKLNPAASAKA